MKMKKKEQQNYTKTKNTLFRESYLQAIENKIYETSKGRKKNDAKEGQYQINLVRLSIDRQKVKERERERESEFNENNRRNQFVVVFSCNVIR